MSDRIDPQAKFIRMKSPPGCEHALAYMMGECRILCAVEEGLWHMSISCVDRDPTWDEIATARYNICPPDVTMAMLLPPLVEYVNLHEHVFHLHEMTNEELHT